MKYQISRLFLSMLNKESKLVSQILGLVWHAVMIPSTDLKIISHSMKLIYIIVQHMVH